MRVGSMTPKSLSTPFAVCVHMRVTSLPHWDGLETTLVPRPQRQLGGGMGDRASQGRSGGIPGFLWAPSRGTAGDAEALETVGLAHVGGSGKRLSLW